MDSFERGNERIAYVLAGIMLMIAVGLSVFALVSSASKGEDGSAYTIILEEDCIRFNGITLDRVELADIESVELLDTLPEGGRRGGGVGTSDYIVGDANYAGIGSCRAYLYKKQAPYLCIRTAEQTFLCNKPDPTESEALYQQLQDALTE